jgi:hypothetical protein
VIFIFESSTTEIDQANIGIAKELPCFGFLRIRKSRQPSESEEYMVDLRRDAHSTWNGIRAIVEKENVLWFQIGMNEIRIVNICSGK